MGRKPEGSTEKIFKKFGKKIDELLDDVKTSTGQATEQAKDELNPRLEELKRNKESIEKEFKGFIEKHKGTWDEFEKNLQKAGGQIKDAFSSAFSKDDKKGD